MLQHVTEWKYAAKTQGEKLMANMHTEYQTEHYGTPKLQTIQDLNKQRKETGSVHAAATGQELQAWLVAADLYAQI